VGSQKEEDMGGKERACLQEVARENELNATKGCIILPHFASDEIELVKESAFQHALEETHVCTDEKVHLLPLLLVLVLVLVLLLEGSRTARERR